LGKGGRKLKETKRSPKNPRGGSRGEIVMLRGGSKRDKQVKLASEARGKEGKMGERA